MGGLGFGFMFEDIPKTKNSEKDSSYKIIFEEWKCVRCFEEFLKYYNLENLHSFSEFSDKQKSLFVYWEEIRCKLKSTKDMKIKSAYESILESYRKIIHTIDQNLQSEEEKANE